MPDEIKTRLELALEVCREAGQLALQYFQQRHLNVERKADNSPVTQADHEAENLMRDRIAGTFPHDGILGEEFGEREGTSAYRWVLDPIDGTKSFISGVPLFSVLIGILRDEESVAGVILIPGLDECVFASRGQGAWWCAGAAVAQPARVSRCGRLAEGLLVVSEVDSFAERGAAEAFLRLQEAADITRTWGDGYGYLLVATGRAVAMVDPVMNLWDAAPLQTILEEAGGSFTDWQGQPTVHHGEGVGASDRVRDEVLAITRQYPRPE